MGVCVRIWRVRVRDIQVHLSDRVRPPAHHQRLVFAGKQLDHDDRTLAQYGLGQGSTLQILSRVCSGMPAKGETTKFDATMIPAESAPNAAITCNSSLLAWAKQVQYPYQAPLKSPIWSCTSTGAS